MKDFIVMSVLLPLLLFFPIQSTLDAMNQRRIDKFDIIVHKATQQARTDGRFTNANIATLRADISAAFPDLSAGEINIQVTDTPKYRLNAFDEREAINYEISVPIKKIFITGVFNIPYNYYTYTKRGYVLSEVLMP